MRKEYLDHSSGTNASPDVYKAPGGLAGWLNTKAYELEKWTRDSRLRRVLRQKLETPEGVDEFITYIQEKGLITTQAERMIEWIRNKPLKNDPLPWYL